MWDESRAWRDADAAAESCEFRYPPPAAWHKLVDIGDG
jgi:hypothetical protein